MDINTNAEEFTIEEENGMKRICFPRIPGNPSSNGVKILNAFFRLYIEDSSDNVFILNHSPCEKLIGAIKKSHPLSKIIFIIHDFGWTLDMIGNVNRFRQLIRHRNDLEDTERKQLARFDKEKRMYRIVDKLVCLSVRLQTKVH